MGQCYGKVNQSKQNGEDEANTTTYVVSGDGNQIQPLTPCYGRAKNTPARSSNPSPWPSPFPHGSSTTASPLPSGVSPSPARTSTPRRFFRRPFPPPSPAKHIKASLIKRLGVKPKEGPIPEERGTETTEQSLDKSFGYGKNFGAKYELGKEVGRGHFGHTCSGRGKKGEIKDQPIAVKIISKSKVLKSQSLIILFWFFFRDCAIRVRTVYGGFLKSVMSNAEQKIVLTSNHGTKVYSTQDSWVWIMVLWDSGLSFSYSRFFERKNSVVSLDRKNLFVWQ